MYIQNYNNRDVVRICKNDLCIEARGKNGEALLGAAVFALICIGLAALISAK